MKRVTQRICYNLFLGCLCVAINACHSTKAPESPAQSGPANSNQPTANTNPVITQAFSSSAFQGAITGKPIDLHSLSESELRFGRAPRRAPDVTYQSDVLIMEEGDKALRAMSSDSITWHFDAHAKDVDQIQVGKVIFATERCVGRVLGMQRNGDDVAVQLGPIQITDVIQQGHFASDEPLDLNSLLAVPAPNLPWISNTQGQQSFLQTDKGHLVSATYAVISPDGAWHPFRTQHVDRRGRLVDAVLSPRGRLKVHSMTAPSNGWIEQSSFVPDQQPGGTPSSSVPDPTNVSAAPDPSIGNLPDVDITGLKMSPCIKGCGGIGVKLGYDKNGIKVNAWVAFHLNNPSLHFNVDISGGHLRTAAIELRGAGGFSYHFDTGTTQEFNGNINQLGTCPIDLSIPYGGFGVPISIHLIQSLTLRTGFSARTSVLSEDGDYTAHGEILVGYANGTWGGAPPNLSINKNIANGVNGISMGINSLVFSIRQEILVGIGMFGFATGPYAAINTTFTALKQASEALVDCRQATFTMSLTAGVGYTLPKPLVSVFNLFLRALHAKEIESTGSFVEMKPEEVVNMLNQIPSGCASADKK